MFRTHFYYFIFQENVEHRCDIRISLSCVDPNPLRVERQDPDNFTRFQTQEKCALEIAAYMYVFKPFKLVGVNRVRLWAWPKS